MDDGRHESSEICDLLQNSVHYKQALHRILHCDVLILDEVSMLSKRLFEQLSTICSLKDGNYCFGNIQLVFSGDFLQLPPVKQSLYNEEGQFCFLSVVYNAHCFANHKFLMIRAYNHPSQPSYELWKHDISVGSVYKQYL
jgi:ATP-dependent exoDNAse (exonuclease V) alpha subunit